MSTWGDVYHRYLHRGHDHGSAAHAADEWAARQKWPCPNCGTTMRRIDRVLCCDECDSTLAYPPAGEPNSKLSRVAAEDGT
jgi:ribosomal protein L37AE/L43A